jgi:hypothetical protein
MDRNIDLDCQGKSNYNNHYHKYILLSSIRCIHVLFVWMNQRSQLKQKQGLIKVKLKAGLRRKAIWTSRSFNQEEEGY